MSCIFVSYSYVFIYLHAFLLTTLFLTLADCTECETNVFASHLVLALQGLNEHVVQSFKELILLHHYNY